jgi:APA family basic amino acid/polyamine antiporter
LSNIFLLFSLPLICQRDLPIGIMGSLLICIALYIGVCLVITGMVPYKFLGEDAPLAEAFTSKGLKYVSVLISIAAIAGLTTTLLVGLYVQVNYFRLVIIDVPL